MQKQIVLDIETTGLEIKHGHKIIEIGAILIQDRKITQTTFHTYLNPERESDLEAYAVHGLSNDFLKNKPLFSTIVPKLLHFLKGAELIIHNAVFDVGFLNHELRQLNQGYQSIDAYCQVTDSLHLASTLHPNQSNKLDALCKRYQVDYSHRKRHGALLDAKLLADVFIRMTSGQLDLFNLPVIENNVQHVTSSKHITHLSSLPVQYASFEEEKAHQAYLKVMQTFSGDCLWSNKTP